jgi:hypothetical protein
MRNSTREIRTLSPCAGGGGDASLEWGHRTTTPQTGARHDLRHPRIPRLLRAYRSRHRSERRDPALDRLKELCAIAQDSVGFTPADACEASSREASPGIRLRDMTNRFSPDRRSTWRQRFLTIAREFEGHGVERRESLDAVRAVRARFLPPRLWRGVRLACRAA